MTEWIKSKRCNLGNSVLIMPQSDGSVLLRDTEDDGQVRIPAASWRAFLLGVVDGDFDCTVIEPTP